MSPTPEVVGARTGMAWSGAAFAALIGGPIAGALVETKTNIYTHGQVFGGAASLLGGVLLAYPALTIARGNKHHQKQSSAPPAHVETASTSIELGNGKPD